MKMTAAVLLMAMLGGCATLFARRPPPAPVAAVAGLDGYQDAAINALVQFNRDLGYVTENTEISRVYFTQADWTPGVLGGRSAEVVFITRSGSGCEWSQWLLGQKNLGEDGWGLPALYPGPQDRDAMSCASLEPGASAAPRSSAEVKRDPQPTWKSPPAGEAIAVVYAQSGDALDVAMMGTKNAAPSVGKTLQVQWWDMNAGTWNPLGTATVAKISGPKMTLTVKTSTPMTNGVRLRW